MRVDDNNDLVSIVMPTFNSSRTIDRALDSILSQTHANWQLVCVDDASGDDTSERIVHRMQAWEDRVTVCRLPQNVGPARARNQGLAQCRGPWIAFLDADDAWRPDRVAVLLEAAARTGADAICDNLMGFDDHLGEETQQLFERLPARLTIQDAVAAEYQGRYNLGYLKPMIKRSFLLQHAIGYDEDLRTGEDLLFLLRILVSGGELTCLNRSLYIYTTPVGSASRKLSRSTTTTPRDADLAAALQRLRDERRQTLSRDEHYAISKRIDYLHHIASVSEFRHARLRRDWIAAFRLTWNKPEVRKWLWAVLRAKRSASH